MEPAKPILGDESLLNKKRKIDEFSTSVINNKPKYTAIQTCDMVDNALQTTEFIKQDIKDIRKLHDMDYLRMNNDQQKLVYIVGELERRIISLERMLEVKEKRLLQPQYNLD